MRVGGALLSLAALASCSPERVEIATPLVEGARSLILAVETAGGGLEVEAIDLASPRSGHGVAPYDGGPLRLTAVLYSDPLDQFGITAGPLAAVPERSKGAAPLPSGRVFEATVEQSRASQWVAVEQLRDGLASFRFQPAGGCFPLSIRSVPLAEQTRLVALAPLDESSVLAVTHGLVPDSFSVLRVTSRALPELVVHVPGVKPSAAARDGEGRLWIAGHASPRTASVAASLLVLDLESRAVAPAPERPSDRRHVGIGELLFVPSARAGDPPVLHALAEDGVLEALDGGVWRTVWQGPSLQGPTGVEGVLAAYGDGDIWVASVSGTSVHRLRGGIGQEVTPQLLMNRRNELESVRTIADVPGFGPIAGTSEGRLLEHTEEGWRVLVSNVPSEESVRSIAVMRGIGFVAGGGYASLQLYSATVGQCPDSFHIGGPGTENVDDLISFGADVVAGASADLAFSAEGTALVSFISRAR